MNFFHKKIRNPNQFQIKIFKICFLNFFKKAFSLIEVSIALLIIAILTAVIYEVSDYIGDFARSSAKNLSRSSIVGRVDDLVIWADVMADKSLDVTEKKDQENILIWSDANPKSQSKPNFNAPTQSLSPQFQLSAINAISSVKYSGSNCLASNSLSNINFDNFVIYLVFTPQSLSNAVILEKYDTNNIAFSLEISQSLYKFSVKDANATIFVNSSKLPKIKQPNLIKISRIKGNKIEIEINGVATSVTDTLTQSTSNSKEINIGCRNATNSPSNFLTGLIGEVAIFNRNLATKEVASIDEYFYKKWKLTKYSGALAIQDWSTCTVPASLNADPSITSVITTSASTSIACKNGFTGSLTYTCSNLGVLATSGSCVAVTCAIPSSLNADPAITTVSVALSPTPLACKTNFSGGISYTCSNTGVLSTTGSCVATSCIYTETGSGNSQCLNSIGETMTINASSTATIILCPYGSAGTSVTEPPQRHMKYRCNSDGTLQFDIRPTCYLNSAHTSRMHSSKHPNDTSTYYINECRWVSGRNPGWPYNCYIANVPCDQTPNYWSF